MDNGSEMLAQTFGDWCEDNHGELVYIQQSNPDLKVYTERFDRSYRTEVLNPDVFINLPQVRGLSAASLIRRIEERLCNSFGRIPPVEFRP